MQQKYISSNTKILALLGYPARHSLSPIIQNRFIYDNGIDAVYVTFEFPPESFRDAFKGARELGIYGLNITMPYKEKAFENSGDLDGGAAATGSVNTVRFDGDRSKGSIRGFNTDIDGILKSLENMGFDPEGRSCLVLGAGGTARSAVFALHKGKAGRIGIYNRTRANAEKIKDTAAIKERIYILDDLEDDQMPGRLDLIINCTPLGMDTSGLKDKIPIPVNWDLKGKMIFETIYKPLHTGFVKKAKEEGAFIIDGLDMLINQAAASFDRWFGIYPDTTDLKKIILREHIKSS